MQPGFSFLWKSWKYTLKRCTTSWLQSKKNVTLQISGGRTFDCVNWDQPAQGYTRMTSAWLQTRLSSVPTLHVQSDTLSRLLVMAKVQPSRRDFSSKRLSKATQVCFGGYESRWNTWKKSVSVTRRLWDPSPLCKIVREKKWKGGTTWAFTALQHRQKVSRSFHQGCELLSSVWSEIIFLLVPAPQ